jgi:hypothetical protein
VRVYIDFNKQKMKMKFPSDTRILYLEEFLKRNLKLEPIEAVYLFRKEQRMLMVPSKTLLDYAREPTAEEVADGNPKREKILNIIMRKSDSF